MGASILIGSTKYIPTARGVRVGAVRNRVLSPSEAFRAMPKGERRALRKALRREGFANHAAQR